jgi:prolyl oligopeptidase
MAAVSYPTWRTEQVIDELHGISIADPYRYLENPDSEETVAFVKAQNGVTKAVFERYGADPEKFEQRLKQLQSFERVGVMMKRGRRTYCFRNEGLQNQDVLLQLPEGTEKQTTAPADLFDSAKRFLDLNELDPAGTTSLGSSAFSEDGNLFAFGLSKAGSDWQTIKVKDTETGLDLPGEECPWVKFSSIAWLKDGSGFFYSRYPPPAAASSHDAGTETNATRNCCLFFHAVGTPSSEDLLVYANPEEAVWLYSAEVTDDGAYLIMKTAKGTDPVARVYIAHLPTVWSQWSSQAKAKGPVNLPEGSTPPKQSSGEYQYLPLFRLIDNWEGDWDYIANDGRRFYFRTNLTAPKYRVVAMDMPDTAHSADLLTAKMPVAGSVDGPTPAIFDVIKEDSKKVLDWATVIANDQLVLCYLKDVAAQLVRCPLPAPNALPALTSAEAVVINVAEDGTGSGDEIPLPGPGTIASFSGKRDHEAFFCKYVSFLSPGQILKVGFQNDAGDTPAGSKKPFSASLFYDTKLAGFNPGDFEATQHMVPSKDGRVKIPLFVVKKKQQGSEAGSTGAALPPTILYGESSGSSNFQEISFA